MTTRRIPICIAIAAAALATTPAHAQSANRGFTAAIAKRIDAIGRAEVLNKRAVGMAIGVVDDGRLVYARGFGYADLAAHRRVGPSTQFYVGAVSEQFTAAAVLLLAQDGKLSLDDKVVKYVPELTVAGNATIAQLLEQTSGLPDLRQAPGISQNRTKPVKLAALFAAVDRMKPSSPPGTAFADNDLNYFVAGLIVERASGLPLSDALQTQIFQPLYMTSTFYATDVGISPDHARGYTGSAGRPVPARPWDSSWLLGAGGLVSNVYDLAKWDVEMPVLLRVDAVRSMFSANGAPGARAYGMGWNVDQRHGKRYIWADGEIAGYRAMNALLPDEHVAVIVLTNADTLRSPTMTFPEAVAAKILDAVAPPPRANLDNTIVARAKEWLVRLARMNVDRTQLTPAFSAYLTDRLVAASHVASYGRIVSVVPISSSNGRHGDVLYEFLVTFAHARYYYTFGVDPTGKIDRLSLAP